jgi:hypothetical protein
VLSDGTVNLQRCFGTSTDLMNCSFITVPVCFVGVEVTEKAAEVEEEEEADLESDLTGVAGAV